MLWHQGLLIPAGTLFVAFDAGGAATLPLVNPGFVPLQGVLAQAAFLDASGTILGATDPLLLGLTQ